MDFKDKKITVVGMGRSGMAAVRVLHRMGAEVTANDSKSAEMLDADWVRFLEEEGIGTEFGTAPSLEGTEMLVLSPGVPTSLPFVEEAQNQGVEIVGEMELAYRLADPDSVFLGITGTNGKTTTTSLVGEIVKAAGKPTCVVGNIGIPAIEEVAGAEKGTWFVTEVSSFQLETIRDFKPLVGALLNVTPDHLDRHKTFENYAAVKGRIFENQDKDCYAVVNFDDKIALSESTHTEATVVPFSRVEEMKFGACVKNDRIVVIDSDEHDHDICGVEELKIPGSHNLENALAAAAITFFAGIDPAVIGDAMRAFGGVEHRIEPCGTIRGVQYFNDSKGTNPDAAIKAIEAMKGDTVIIAGGYDKGADYHEFLQAFAGKVYYAVLIGSTAVKIKGQAEEVGFTNTILVENMEQAVAEAARVAKPGDNVLLSPACASWDMYSSYEERGRHFKACVAALREAEEK